MHSHLQPAGPASIGAATALAILTDATHRLDAMRLNAEREIYEYVRSREHIESLIDRLIAGLDAEDAADEDREPADDIEGSDGIFPIGDVDLPEDWRFMSGLQLQQRPAGLDDDCEPSHGWTTGEAARGVPYQGSRYEAEEAHDGRESEDEDGDSGESYGRGYGPCAAQRAKRERLFSGVAVGMLATFERGRLTSVRAISSEGRAQA